MTQIEEIKRLVPGAELFFGESVAQYLAELSDEAYSSEAEAEGLLLGRIFRDDQGTYVVVSGVTQNSSKLPEAVGWFKSSLTGCDIGPADVSRINSLFGNMKTYAIAVDSVQGNMAMYSVEFGVARKVPSMMVENL